MSEQHIQASFNSGEWSPKLFSRVDLAKYKSGAALLLNWFVDYRGGASTRTGTKYILQCYKSATAVRLIPFQASFTVGYVLEFGDRYVRFFFNGAPVLESAIAITGATQANPCVLTIVGNTYAIGDWIFVTGIAGMTQLNGRYFSVTNVAGNNVTIANLNGVAINATAYGAYTSGGTSARVYTITSPYLAADLAKVKYAQNVSQMVLCHPSYNPYVLTLITATNWTLVPITIGSTATIPTIFGTAATFPSPGANPAVTNYGYVVTSIDSNGQESSPSTVAIISSTYDIRVVAGSLQVTWNTVSGAIGYNVYKSDVSYFGTVPTGISYGFVGSVAAPGTTFVDANITPDFAQTPPIAKNPFQGAGVASVTVTAASTYTSVPSVSFSGASTIVASGAATLTVQGTPTVSAGGAGYVIGDTVSFTNGVVLIVNTVAAGVITSWKAITAFGASAGQVTSGSTPANPVAQISTSGVGTGAQATLTWGVGLVTVTAPGAGYAAPPTVVFSPAGATATSVLGASSNGFPTVPAFFQQRLILAGPTASPQTFYMSQPGAYYNFNVSSPPQATDSITATLVSGQLNTIKSMVSQTTGLLVLTDRASWLINGGSPGSAITPAALVANAQSFNGVSDIQPIIANYDVLYVQAKGSIVRDSSYNIYANVYTGTDISILASHLFYGFSITSWTWAEEPFKMAWAVRSDGTMLTLTFLKEQEFIGWAHSTTVGGLFQSVTSITEQNTPAGTVDAVYSIVQRTVSGFTVQYIERFAERIFANGVTDAWCVDAGLQYTGSPATSFSGAEHLAGLTVTGLADGIIIAPFVMSASGQFTLGVAASKVTVGISYTCDLQTLAIDLGEPTIQGRVKKIQDVDARVAETLGLSVGSDFTTLVTMKDLIRGNISSMLTGLPSQVVTDLVTGDAKSILDPTYTVYGQTCFRQSNPYPATVLGVILNVDEHQAKRVGG